MIHTLHGPPEPRRRIAVIQIPRAQKSRLGRLGIIRSENWIAGPNTTALTSWVPLADLTTTLLANGSSITPEQWQALILQQQSQAQEQTPGTLQYTPAPADPSPATILPPWTSWQTDECNPDAGNAAQSGASSPAAAAAAAAPSSYDSGPGGTPWVVIAGFLGAAASLVYLRAAAKGRAA